MSDLHADLTAWLDAPERFTDEDIQNMAGALQTVLQRHKHEQVAGIVIDGQPAWHCTTCGVVRRRWCSEVFDIATAVGVTETRQETNR